MYDCRVCEKEFPKFILLEGHFAFSHKCRSKKNIFLQCHVCKKSFQHSATLKFHLQLHSTKHLKKPHKHSQCSDGNIQNVKNFDTNQQNHQQDASQITEFKCNMCERSFRSRFALHRHLIEHDNINISKRHASSPIISSVLFRCKVCKIFLGSRERLATHENVHVNGKIKCEICQIKFTEKSLRWHNKLSHPHLATIRSIPKPLKRNLFIENESRMDESRKDKVKVKLPKTALACEICNIICENRKRLDCHLKVHVDGQFKCEICQIFFTKRSLDMHEKRLHPHVRKQRILEALRNPKPKKHFETKRKQTNYDHQCSVCKLLFINEKQLETHMRIHIYGDVECEICKIRFTKRSLEMHMRRRHAEQLTQQIISKALERHNVKQSNEIQEKKSKYRYQCSVCKLLFLTRKVLDVHMKIHTDGNVECKICSIRFTKRTLFMHERRCHPQLQTKPIFLNTQEGHVSNVQPSGISEMSRYRYRYRQQCSVCKIFCLTQMALDIHMRVHINGDVECKICRIPFTKRSLRMHEQRRHPELQTKPINSIETNVTKQRSDINEKKPAYRYQCSVCKLFFMNTKLMDTHMKIHIYGDVECKICRIRFTKRSLNIHERRRHPELLVTKPFITKPELNVTPKRNQITEKRSAYRYQCSVCKLLFITTKALDTHMRVHIEGNVKCKICHIQFTKRSLFPHERRCHPELSTKLIISKSQARDVTKQHNTPEAPQLAEELLNPIDDTVKRKYRHICDICNLICQTAERLVNHKRVHSVGNIKCEVCQVSFTQRSILKHRNRAHPGWQTPSILKAVENTTVPEMHNTHEESQHSKDLVEAKDDARQLKYQCDLCELYCYTAKRLEKHKMVHSVGNLKCEVCQVMFTEVSLVKHQIRAHPHWRKQSILKAVENPSVPEMHNTPEASQQSEELLKPIGDTVKRKYHHICDICNLICQTAERLVNHKRVHSFGNIKCEVCQVSFTQRSILKHRNRAHPGWQTPSILKAVENTTVPEMIGKKQTSMKDFNSAINKRRHTVHISNTVKHEPPPFLNRRLSEYREFKCGICDKVLRTQEYLNDHTKSHFQCYICKKYFETMSHLSPHLKRHILYQQWVDPLNVHLSNWSFTQSREILQNQPLVLVENLEINNINLKSLSQYDQRIQNVVNDLDNSKEKCSINEPRSMVKNELPQCILDEDSFKREDNGVCANYAEQRMDSVNDLPMNNNQRPMSQELSNIICADIIDVDSLLVDDLAVDNSIMDCAVDNSVMDCAVDSTVIDISSGDESDVEASDQFFCYFCERLFHSCDALGVHMDRCTMK